MGCLVWLIYILCAIIILAAVHFVWVTLMMSTLALTAKIAVFAIFVLFLVVYLIASIVDCKY